jgi:hypothetical protein
MTTGRINQVAAMRAPVPNGGHRRAVDDGSTRSRRDRRVSHSTDGGQPCNRVEPSRRRSRPQTADDHRASIYRSQSELPLRGRTCKTAGCVTERQHVGDWTGPDERELFTVACRMELALGERDHGRATDTECLERD